MRLMESNMTVFCIGFLLLFMRHQCERNKNLHTGAFGVPPPKNCTPHCEESPKRFRWWCCGDANMGSDISKDRCEQKCSEMKSCCKKHT
ncbi:hypothetical protein Hanom_Chr16g01426991 [Helianthus anomalus]